MILDYLKMAGKNLQKRRLRAFLTLIGIMISISTIFVLVSLSLGLESAVEEQFRMLGTDKFFVQPKGQLGGLGTGSAAMLTEIDLDVITKLSGVKEVSFAVAANAKIELDNNIRYTLVSGLDIDSVDLFMETGSFAAEEGQMLTKGDRGVVVLGSQYKYNNFLGQEVKIGDKILINDQYGFKVKGIVKTLGNPTDDRMIYLPLEEFRLVFNIPERIDYFVVQVEDEAELAVVAERAEKKLMQARGVDENSADFTILMPEQLLDSFGSILSIITSFLLGIAFISLLVGGIGIANTMYTSVLERTKEIGIMKAIGAQNKDILVIFLLESGLLGLIGGIVGVAVGMGIGKTIEFIALNFLGTTLLQVSFPTYLIGGSLLFSFMVGSAAGLMPAWKAVKIEPVEALRRD
ncbi:MAG TPA: ABC transporter permease [Candidatus Nanoarchaeia archaeon]|nr:ABC transporter permease [Candidatus Nanoarchaeia archaeon]